MELKNFLKKCTVHLKDMGETIGSLKDDHGTEVAWVDFENRNNDKCDPVIYFDDDTRVVLTENDIEIILDYIEIKTESQRTNDTFANGY